MLRGQILFLVTPVYIQNNSTDVNDLRLEVRINSFYINIATLDAHWCNCEQNLDRIRLYNEVPRGYKLQKLHVQP